MRILVVHNQLWAHYKSILFEEIQTRIKEKHPGSEFLVAQIALYEQSRAAMASEAADPDYRYSYQVLFRRSLDTVTFKERLTALFSLFNSYKPDVLNITGYFDYAQVLLLLYAKVRGVKTIISSESSVVDKDRSFSREFLKKLFLKQADGFFCFGTTSVNYLLDLEIPDHKILVKKAAVVDNYRLSDLYQKAIIHKKGNDRRHFIYVGRLAPEKNLEFLLQAFAHLNQALPIHHQWGLILVGEGPDRQNLEKFVEVNQLPHVTFTGGKTWQQIPAQLANADVLVLPSLSEPWGLVVNEAMLCGMPVVVSDRSGCAPDLVKSGQNGFLIDPLSMKSLVTAMMAYATNPSLIPQHGNRSKELVAAFSPKQVADSMVDSYYNLFLNK